MKEKIKLLAILVIFFCAGCPTVIMDFMGFEQNIHVKPSIDAQTDSFTDSNSDIPDSNSDSSTDK